MLHYITSQSAILLSTASTIIYVAVLYLHPAARPTRHVTKDHPSVIKARMLLVSLACLAAAVITLQADGASIENYTTIWKQLFGFKLNLAESSRSMGLVALLFLGPLYEYILVENGLLGLLQDLIYACTSWIGIRNYIVGPFTEEFVFRACIIPLHVLAGLGTGRIILTTPLFFGIAHVHHVYEKTITKSATLTHAILISSIQFAYTTMFGWLASFLFMRTGSLWICVAVHSFCNGMGLPRVSGRLSGHWVHTPIYYTLLLVGAYFFAQNIETLTSCIPGYQAP